MVTTPKLKLSGIIAAPSNSVSLIYTIDRFDTNTFTAQSISTNNLIAIDYQLSTVNCQLNQATLPFEPPSAN
jgi:hypothetical protein